MDKVSDERKTRRTRKRDSMRSPTEHAVQEPDNAPKGSASSLKSTQDDSSEGNGSERIDDRRLSDAIDDVESVLSVSTSRYRVRESTHDGECKW